MLQFTELDTKAVLIEKFIKNKAKFHKTCTSKFSNLKLERAEKRARSNEDDENDDETLFDEGCSSSTR